MPLTSLGMIREALRRDKSASSELVALDHGAHGAVDDQDALVRGLLQRGQLGLRLMSRLAFHPDAPWPFAAALSPPWRRSPSRWQMA